MIRNAAGRTPSQNGSRVFGAAIAFAFAVSAPSAAGSQSPLRHWTDAVDARFAASQPVIVYALRVDPADTTGFDVTMDVRGAHDTTLLAMAAHPEYDDRYWRYVRDARVDAAGGRALVSKPDSALWRVIAPGGSFVMRYRVVLPTRDPRARAAWQPFVAPTGALVGGIHSFMYVVGQTLAPSHVRLDVPADWLIATGLAPTVDARTFYAPSAAVLVESPMLVGRLRDWRFTEGGVPHRVVYWPRPDATAFDTTAVVDGIRRVVRGAVALFGRAPYRDYTFMLQDGAVGALEHPNSVTLGVPSRTLAGDMGPVFREVAHEYFHAWNLMRIRPAEYGDLTYRTPTRSRGLWFSEGLSLFYVDLLLRRAGLPVDAPTRSAHLESLIARYLATPGNARFSAERVSVAEYGGQPGALGNNTASSHLQGELIGTMLDLEIRHATAGRRSVDDVMRLMLERFGGERGFTGRDVEHVVNEVCGCSVTPFFDTHVRGGQSIPFDSYLRHIGLRTAVAWRPALGVDGSPAPDLRVYPYDAGDGAGPQLVITNPESAWDRAGIRTGDHVRSMNGTPTSTSDAVRLTLRQLRTGDTVRVEVERGGTTRTVTVVMAPFTRPFVELQELPGATPAQRALRARWESGAP